MTAICITNDDLIELRMELEEKFEDEINKKDEQLCKLVDGMRELTKIVEAHIDEHAQQ